MQPVPNGVMASSETARKFAASRGRRDSCSSLTATTHREGPMKSRTRISCLAAVLVSLAPAYAGAETALVPTVSLDRCAADDAARVRFLEERLDSRRTYADYWWKGWMGGYALGTVIEAVQASTHDDEG